jgi:hypothetical protein
MPDQAALYMQPRIGIINPIYLEEWEIVRTFAQFVIAFTKHHAIITHISFDHDLANISYNPITQQEHFEYREKTGYDCAKWLVNFCEENNIPLPIYFIHSMNPIGAENIKGYLESYKRSKL